jgi:ribokinase
MLNASPVTARISLPEVDVLVVNEGEAQVLSGIPVTDADSAAAAAAELGRSAGAVVVTMGAAGSVLREGDKVTRVAARPVAAVDATGAGDAFVGAVAFGLAEGRSLAEAVDLGSAAGAVAVTRMGARSSLPTLAETQHP